MDKRYSFAPCVAWQIEPTEDFVYVLNNHKKEFLHFYDVSKEIWMLLSEGKTVREIINRLSESYQVSKDDVEEDVIQFLNTLVEEGVITVQ